jgi:hypothetical protein
VRQRSALKDARFLRKLGKRLGIPGAGLPRILATVRQLKADAASRTSAEPSNASQPAALAGDGSLDALLRMIESMQPVAGSIKDWHKPQPVELTGPMRALRNE